MNRPASIGLVSPGIVICTSQVAAAAETWLRKMPGPETYIRNVRVFANNPSAGQSIGIVSTLGSGIV